MATELERMGGIGDCEYAVRWDVVRSAAYRRKFDQITGEAAVNATLYAEAIRMLEHRNNSDFEDLSVINLGGELIGRSTRAVAPGAVRYTDSINWELAKSRHRGDRLITIHNHPNSYPPSGSDIGSMLLREYIKSVVCCHDGTVYVIDSVDSALTETLIRLRYARIASMAYNDLAATEKLLQSLVRDYGLKWRRL